ncbi:hypothetical protein K501DRAFT_274321 [Backusella circina FSU 941]|nr:hypothetical protein K501DRAFT_274321 [Backusella circina FSU 941]
MNNNKPTHLSLVRAVPRISKYLKYHSSWFTGVVLLLLFHKANIVARLRFTTQKKENGEFIEGPLYSAKNGNYIGISKVPYAPTHRAFIELHAGIPPTDNRKHNG